MKSKVLFVFKSKFVIIQLLTRKDRKAEKDKLLNDLSFSM